MSHMKVSVFLVCSQVNVLPNHQIMFGYTPEVNTNRYCQLWMRSRRASMVPILLETRLRRIIVSLNVGYKVHLKYYMQVAKTEG